MAAIGSDRLLTKNFTAFEMMCRCHRPDCDALPMRDTFMAKLEALREAWGSPLHSTSAARCVYWNRVSGGAISSEHLVGNASDFWFTSIDDKTRFVTLASSYFKGIGIGTHLVHVDDRKDLARWTYANK